MVVSELAQSQDSLSVTGAAGTDIMIAHAHLIRLGLIYRQERQPLGKSPVKAGHGRRVEAPALSLFRDKLTRSVVARAMVPLPSNCPLTPL